MKAGDDRRQVAVALGYAWGGAAPPRILAAGAGPIAERIVATARASGVAVREDAPLAESLVRLEVGSHVPPELWQAVATVLAFLYRVDAAVAAAPPSVRPPA